MKPKGKKSQVTIRDIANVLHITPSTVSRALHNHPNISNETKRLVNDCAEQMHYQRNTAASSLRTGKTNTIGVIVPRINSHFISSAIGGIETVADKAGYSIIICQSNETIKAEINAVQTLLSKRVDGLLVSVSMETNNSDHFREIMNRKIPLVFFDRICPDLEVSNVTINDFKGAYQATEHLISQRCKKIAYFGGSLDLAIYRNRLAGYLQALKDYQLLVKEEMIFMTRELTDNMGQKWIQSMHRNNNLPDGICSSNDNLAAGAMKYLMEHQVRIPDTIAIIGFSKTLFSQWITPPLSTVDQHSELIGNHAATLLLEEIQQSSTGRHTPHNIVIDPELIIRASSLRTNRS